MRKQFLLTGLLYCIIFFNGYSQDVNALKKEYPGEEVVVLNSSITYDLGIENGQPVATSKNTQQLLYLSPNSSVYLSRYGFSESSFHELMAYDAYTKTPDNKKIRVTDFKTTDDNSSSIFYDDVKQTNFDFPNLTEGATGNLETTYKHKDTKLLSPFYFSRGVPVLNASLRINFPKNIVVKYIIKGMNQEKIVVKQEMKKNIQSLVFSATHLPAENRYSDAPDNAYYATHIIFYIEGFTNDNGNFVKLLGTPEDLHRMNFSHISEINKEVGPELKETVDLLIKNCKSEEEKSRKIYSWVQENIKYVAFENGMEGFVPRDANLVCSRRFGDCKDMSSILTSMLNYAGIKAYYTWIGTRSIPYDYTEVALPIVDNHMICTINLNNQFIFLDGTDPACVFGMPSEHIQGKQAFLSIDKEHYQILRVPVPTKEQSVLEDTTILEITDNGLKGSIIRKMTGYFSIDEHISLNYVNEKDKEDHFKKIFNRGSNKFLLTKFENPDLKDKNSVTLKAEFTLKDYAKNMAGEWYINMNLFKFYEHQEIDFPKRKIPIEYSHLSKTKFVTILKIPPGYKLAYLPESKKYINEVWGFNLAYEKKEDRVILIQEFDNDYMLLAPDKFQLWNQTLENLFPLYKESVNLTKQ